MKRDLKLREEHQLPAKDKIIEKYLNAILTKKKVKFVLAMSPNSGKTEVSISCIEEVLKLTPDARVLVLTHSTNVIKDNFLNRLAGLNLNFNYSDSFDPNCQVHVTIPQNIMHIRGIYDLAIIDEGHDNYLAEQEQTIVNNVKSKMDLILTATPSRLIAEGGFIIHAVGATEMTNEHSAKINLELVASKGVKWTEVDYNSIEDISSKYEYRLEEVEETMNSVVLQLLERLESGISAEDFNMPSLLRRVKCKLMRKLKETMSWNNTFNGVGKTMIVTQRIDQANMIYDILKKYNVDVTISHSKNDPNSEIFFNFHNNKKGLIIVVDRGQIGYNDANLFNIIDMSGTRNPNLIYQMMFRVARGNQNMEKYYIKVVPNNLIDMGITETYVNVAINLMDKDFLLAYNGKNLKNLNIPILSKPRQIKPDKDDDIINGGGGREPGVKSPTVLPIFEKDLVKTLKDIKHDLNSTVSIYKIGSIEDAKRIIRGEKEKVVKKTFEELLASARQTVIEYE